MNPRAFTTKVEYVHRNWLANVLGLSASSMGGIDLYDARICIELKSRYTRYNHSFAVDARQRKRFAEENPSCDLFWAFLIYDLSHSPKSIGQRFIIERFITKRDVWILPWDWIDQFPIATPRTGPYYYVHRKDFPREMFMYTRGNARIHLRDRSIEERLSTLEEEEALQAEA